MSVGEFFGWILDLPLWAVVGGLVFLFLIIFALWLGPGYD
jgi:ABC-type multidrug transport system permease subunit